MSNKAGNNAEGPDREKERAERMERMGLAEGDCYFTEEGYMVFTEQYHLKRGYCCQSGCRHCPYGFNKRKQPE